MKSNVSGSMSGSIAEDPSEGSEQLLQDEEVGPPGFIAGSMKMFKANKIYALLIFVPLAIMAEFAEAPEYAIFFLACLAILPLAGLLGDATEQVALHTNDTLGGLLNATFGNATEMIVCYFALKANLLSVVQVSLLGSILSNTLLVLGFSCLAGGLKYTSIGFNRTAAQANTTLLQIAILGLIVPTLMNGVGQLPVGGVIDLELSRSISGALLVLYVLYVYFQLFTHRKVFEDPRGGEAKAPTSAEEEAAAEEEEEEEEDDLYLSMSGGIFWLSVSTVAIAYLSELLTGSIEGAADGVGLSRTFVGFVILPIIGNAAEHSTAVVMANKGKMDLAFGVALGSSTQIALFVIPVMVWVAWAMDKPLDLLFGNFETSIIFLSSLLVSHIVSDGETNWLEGVMLLFAYMIICFAFFFYEPVHVEA